MGCISLVRTFVITQLKVEHGVRGLARARRETGFLKVDFNFNQF